MNDEPLGKGRSRKAECRRRGSSHALPARSSRMIRLCSDMFGYLRIFSLSGKSSRACSENRLIYEMGSGKPESGAGQATRAFFLRLFFSGESTQNQSLVTPTAIIQNRNGPGKNGIFAKRTQFIANAWITIICSHVSGFQKCRFPP